MSKARLLTVTGAFAALIAAATLYLRVPGPTGYYHMGDGIIYVAALLLGMWPAAAAAALGSALADVLSGFASFAPWTFVIKGLTAMTVAALAGANRSRTLLGMLGGALITVLGYALATSVLYDPAAAVAETVGNVLQVTVGVIVGSVLLPMARRVFR